MSEERYRIWKLIILGVFVVGALIIGGRISESLKQSAENGRYIQHDRMKDKVTTGGSTIGHSTQFIDTRAGSVVPAGTPK